MKAGDGYFIYLSSFQRIPPSPTPTLLPSLSFGWIAGFEQSVSSCQLSSFAFEPYLSLISWFLTKEFCCLWVLQRGLSFLQEKEEETQGSCLLKIWKRKELPLALLLSLTFFPALIQIKIIFFLSIPSCSRYQLYITDNHYWENPSTVHWLEGILKECLFNCKAGPDVSNWWIIRIQQSMNGSIRRFGFPNCCWWHWAILEKEWFQLPRLPPQECLAQTQSLWLRLIDVNPIGLGFISKSSHICFWQLVCPERTRQCPLVERALGLKRAQCTLGFSVGCCSMEAPGRGQKHADPKRDLAIPISGKFNPAAEINPLCVVACISECIWTRIRSPFGPRRKRERQGNTGLSFSFHLTLSNTCDLFPKISMEGISDILGADELSPKDNEWFNIITQWLRHEKNAGVLTFPNFSCFSPCSLHFCNVVVH